MPEKMKLVTTRMEPSLHRKAMKEAKRWGESFGKFVRKAVANHIQVLDGWEPADAKSARPRRKQ